MASKRRVKKMCKAVLENDLIAIESWGKPDTKERMDSARASMKRADKWVFYSYANSFRGGLKGWTSRRNRNKKAARTWR